MQTVHKSFFSFFFALFSLKKKKEKIIVMQLFHLKKGSKSVSPLKWSSFKSTKIFLMKSQASFIKSDCVYIKSCFRGHRLGRLLSIQLFLLLSFPLYPLPSKSGKRMQNPNPGSACFRELTKALKWASVGIQHDCAFERLKSGDAFHQSGFLYSLRHWFGMEWIGTNTNQC